MRVDETPLPKRETAIRAQELQVLLDPCASEDRRERARFFFVSETASMLSSYRKIPPPEGKDIRPSDPEELESIRADKSRAIVYGEWVATVTRIEEANEARLQTLLLQSKAARELNAKHPGDTGLEELADKIDGFMRAQYRVAYHPDMTCDVIRNVARKNTREASVLPRWMRHPGTQRKRERGLVRAV